MGVPPDRIVKTLLYDADGDAVAVLLRGDRELNEIKLKNLLGAVRLELAAPGQVRSWTGSFVGFAGPVGLQVKRIVADQELCLDTNWVAGANKNDTHLRHVNLARDVSLSGYHDLRQITDRDNCPKCGAALELTRGIEAGHVFKLGVKYSEAMNAVFLDEEGKERPMIMGCYGIGVSRVVAACIEQNHDDKGIVFPPPLAPFQVLVLNLNPGDEAVTAKAANMYSLLSAQGIDVLLDDRDERPGFKFKDADLIGVPMQLVVGGKGLAKGIVEAKDRRTGERAELPVEGFQAAFDSWRQTVLDGWGLAKEWRCVS